MDTERTHLTPTHRLDVERNIWISTTRPDGRPHLAPVWFVYLSDRFWVGTGRRSVRTRNVRADPSASVALESGDHPVIAECAVRIHERERPPAVAAAFLDKYDWDVTVEVDEDIGEVVLLELAPRRWLFDLELPVTS